MQTRTYGDLFTLTSSLIGATALSVDECGLLATFINRRFEQAFDESPIWNRYLINSEPRTLTPHQTIPTSEDGFYIYGAGDSDTTGLYQYNREYSNHNSYVLNGNTLSFSVSAYAAIPDYVGNYKFDASYSIGGQYDRGAWVNQTNGNKVIVYNAQNASDHWELYDIATGTSEASSPTTNAYFPWQTSFTGLVFSKVPSEAYNIERNESNNHWELVKQSSTGTATVLYKDGNGNTPAETVWEIVNAPNPSPIVHDLDNIGEFIRVHRNQAFINNSAIEYDFFVDARGANILNIRNDNDSVAYVTYKQEFTPFSPTLSNPIVIADYYESGENVPAEFFNFIAHASYADFLRVQNRAKEAIAEEQVAQTYLSLELEKIDIRTNNNTVNKRFSTYVNRQSR